MTNRRIPYISLMQIIGPLLVVLGHSLNGLDSGEGVWYAFSKEWIYIFHMPLFFLVSGYLLSFKGYLGEKGYGQFVLGKVKRLIVPYMVWNLLFWVPKFAVRDLVVDEVSLSVVDTLKAFIFPRQNIWGHTWFLAALFMVYLATPFFQSAFTRENRWVHVCSLLFCIALYVLPIKTEFLAFSDLHKDLYYFVLGCILGQMEVDKFKSVLKKFRSGLISCANILSGISLVWFETTKPLDFISCTVILFAFLSIFVEIETLPAYLEKLASCSFGIYIMHWPVMITVRVVLYQIMGASLPITVIMMILLGYSVPILIVMGIRALPFERIKEPLKYLLGV